MTDSTREEKMARFFSIIGFVVMVVLLAWLAIQFVRFLPTAFTSLANIFEDNQQALHENVNNDDDEDSNGSVVVVVEDEDDNTADQDTSWDLPEYIDDSSDTDVEVEDDIEEATTDNTSANDTVYYTTIETYSVPQSDPNGYTDLQISFIAVGRMADDDRFFPGQSLSEGDRGAIQFQVKNIGTKTSTNWQFLTELPSGFVTESQVQQPLKPKEYSVLTIAFTAPESGTKQIGAAINTSVDTNTVNNSFKTTVYISN